MTKANAGNTNPDDGFTEVKPHNAVFNKVDDYIKGTYIEKIEMNQPDQWGKIKNAYVVKVDEAIMTDSKTGQVLPLEAGQFWKVWGGKPVIDNGFMSAKIGQKVIVKLVELRPSKLGHDAKIMKVLLGGMDPEHTIDDSF